MRTWFKIFFIPFLIFALASCSDEKDSLRDAIADSWDEIESDIEDSAEERLEYLAENPEQLYKGDCETDYMPLGHIFTLTIPIDYTGRAAIGLLFGSDAAEFLSLVEDANRSSKSKSEIKKLIQKHFNSYWAEMMVALVVLDGEFDYDFESENWLDNSYEFDSKALYKILEDKGYFTPAK